MKIAILVLFTITTASHLPESNDKSLYIKQAADAGYKYRNPQNLPGTNVIPDDGNLIEQAADAGYNYRLPAPDVNDTADYQDDPTYYPNYQDYIDLVNDTEYEYSSSDTDSMDHTGSKYNPEGEAAQAGYNYLVRVRRNPFDIEDVPATQEDLLYIKQAAEAGYRYRKPQNFAGINVIPDDDNVIEQAADAGYNYRLPAPDVNNTDDNKDDPTYYPNYQDYTDLGNDTEYEYSSSDSETVDDTASTAESEAAQAGYNYIVRVRRNPVDIEDVPVTQEDLLYIKQAADAGYKYRIPQNSPDMNVIPDDDNVIDPAADAGYHYRLPVPDVNDTADYKDDPSYKPDYTDIVNDTDYEYIASYSDDTESTDR